MVKILHTTVKRETEKAFLVALEVSDRSYTITKTKDVWFPKSQVQVTEDTVECPQWLAAKKLEELDWHCVGLVFTNEG